MTLHSLCLAVHCPAPACLRPAARAACCTRSTPTAPLLPSPLPSLQGTPHERELAAGASRALRWADVLRPLRLCVRVQVRRAVPPDVVVARRGGRARAQAWLSLLLAERADASAAAPLIASGPAPAQAQEAGWLWSGGFELDTPGDMFIKIR